MPLVARLYPESNLGRYVAKLNHDNEERKLRIYIATLHRRRAASAAFASALAHRRRQATRGASAFRKLRSAARKPASPALPVAAPAPAGEARQRVRFCCFGGDKYLQLVPEQTQTDGPSTKPTLRVLGGPLQRTRGSEFTCGSTFAVENAHGRPASGATNPPDRCLSLGWSHASLSACATATLPPPPPGTCASEVTAQGGDAATCT